MGGAVRGGVWHALDPAPHCSLPASTLCIQPRLPRDLQTAAPPWRCCRRASTLTACSASTRGSTGGTSAPGTATPGGAALRLMCVCVCGEEEGSDGISVAGSARHMLLLLLLLLLPLLLLLLLPQSMLIHAVVQGAPRCRMVLRWHQHHTLRDRCGRDVKCRTAHILWLLPLHGVCPTLADPATPTHTRCLLSSAVFVPVSVGALQSDWSFVRQADKYSLWADAQVWGPAGSVRSATPYPPIPKSRPPSPPRIPARSRAAPPRATPTRLCRTCGRCGGSAW